MVIEMKYISVNQSVLPDSGQVQTVEFLVSEGARKEATNTVKQGAVHLAVAKTKQNKTEMLKTLKKLQFPINEQVMDKYV